MGVQIVDGLLTGVADVAEMAEETTESREPEPDDDARHERVMAIARRIIERDAVLLDRLGTG